MVELTIDNKKIRVAPGTTILSACGALGIEIPRFCYHEELSIAGNCRMCLVQVKNAPKPVASCAMPVMEGMVVDTKSELVKKAREGVMSFLLKNHPLDCPICDQAGECDLQDQALHFGSDRGRYYHSKRGANDNLNTGPLIKTIMTRCIHCTRCIRFAEEIGGIQVYGTTGRGEETQVGTYIENLFDSPLSGNVIDLCPVGALTNKPYSFKARPWELKHTETYETIDMECNPIRVDHVGHEVQRILPRQEIGYSPWISDRTRYSFDGIYNQRLDQPLMKGSDDQWEPLTWVEMFEQLENEVSKNKKWVSLAGPSSSLETLFALQAWENRWMELKGLKISSTTSYSWNKVHWQTSLYDSTEPSVQSIILVNTSIADRAPVLLSRIGQLVRQNKLKVYTIGTYPELNFKYKALGTCPKNVDLSLIKTLPKGKTGVYYSAELFKSSLAGYYKVILETFEKELDCEWNCVHNGPAALGSFLLDTPDLVYKTFDEEITEPTILYLVNYDEKALLKNKYFKKAYKQGLLTIVYQGSHGDLLAPYSKYILPSATYVEESATFVNPQGNLIESRAISKPVGLARSNWDILRHLYDWVWQNEMPKRSDLVKVFSTILMQKEQEKNNKFPILKSKQDLTKWSENKLFIHSVFNFYNYNALCRASKTMKDCIIFNKT